MKFQVAMDMTTIEEYWNVLDQIHDLVDIIEVGVIGSYEGSKLIKLTKDKYPELKLLWDSKAQFLYVNEPAINFGVDYVTVDANAPDKCFHDHFEFVKGKNCEIVGDMYDAQGTLQMIRLDELGCDQITFHPNIDESAYPVGDVLQLDFSKKVIKKADVCAYGGFTLDNIDPVLELKPEIVCVGAAVWAADNPRDAVLNFKEKINQYL